MNNPVFEVGFGWLVDSDKYPRGTLLYAAQPSAQGEAATKEQQA